MCRQNFPRIAGIIVGLFILGVLILAGLSSCRGEPTPVTDYTNLPLVIQSNPTKDGSNLPLIIDDALPTEEYNLPLIINKSDSPEEISQPLATAASDSSLETHLPIIAQGKILSDMTPLAFKTIEQMDFAGTGQMYQNNQPTVLIFSSFEDVLSINGLVTEDAIDQLAALDYDTHFSLIVFDGLKPALGYGIEVIQAIRDDGSLYVDARRTEPEPGSTPTGLQSSPYHLIAVEKGSNWEGNVTFVLLINNEDVYRVERIVP